LLGFDWHLPAGERKQPLFEKSGAKTFLKLSLKR
jgi:hypothetical protein